LLMGSGPLRRQRGKAAIDHRDRACVTRGKFTGSLTRLVSRFWTRAFGQKSGHGFCGFHVQNLDTAAPEIILKSPKHSGWISAAGDFIQPAAACGSAGVSSFSRLGVGEARRDFQHRPPLVLRREKHPKSGLWPIAEITRAQLVGGISPRLLIAHWWAPYGLIAPR